MYGGGSFLSSQGGGYHPLYEKCSKNRLVRRGLIIISFFFYMNDSVSDVAQCKDGFATFKNSCYRVNNNNLSRSDAAAACERTNHSHLADIGSFEEHEFLVDLLTNASVKHAWFGLQLQSSSGVWSDGSLLLDEEWYEIKTDDNSMCFRLRKDETSNLTYSWDDTRFCGNNYRYICEYEGICINSK